MGNRITGAVIGAAIEVHRTLGPGLLESAYEAALKKEMELRGLQVRQQVDCPLSTRARKLTLVTESTFSSKIKSS